MNILLLNQCFYPDVVSTAQHLTDLALELTERGHKVTVVTSDRGYDDPTKRFPRRETWQGIEIIRISSLALGKESKVRRALNFASFLINCTARLLLLRRFDVVVALTSPPLISFLGSLFAQLKGGRFFFWVMDLNPDEAIAAGWLKESSLPAKTLEALLRYSLRRAERIIVLDRFMKKRVLAKGISEQRIVVLPPWPYTHAIGFDKAGREAFREQHDLKEKFVVMYSGNHSPCHPLETLLESARQLSATSEIVFCFVGGGSEKKKVQEFAASHSLQNVVCLPYQPLATLSASLSAADLHVVVMGENFVGIVHPCKVYNVLAVGSPFLYIGPDESHVIDIAGGHENENSIFVTRHGDPSLVAKQILKAASRLDGGVGRAVALPEALSRDVLLPGMIAVLEAASTAPAVAVTAVSQTSA